MTDKFVLRRDWPDIFFTATAEVGTYSVDFSVYAIEGIDSEGVTLWHLAGSPSYPDPTDSLDKAERYLNGAVKWDGCSDWHFDEQDRVMLHGCSRQNLVDLGDVMARCWDWAAELLPNFDGRR
jgi:hypothetical protein